MLCLILQVLMLLLWVPPLKKGRGLGTGVQVQGGQADGADQCYDVMEQEYTEVSLNVTVQMCINHCIDFSSVQSCGVTKPDRALCV